MKFASLPTNSWEPPASVLHTKDVSSDFLWLTVVAALSFTSQLFQWWQNLLILIPGIHRVVPGLLNEAWFVYCVFQKSITLYESPTFWCLPWVTLNRIIACQPSKRPLRSCGLSFSKFDFINKIFSLWNWCGSCNFHFAKNMLVFFKLSTMVILKRRVCLSSFPTKHSITSVIGTKFLHKYM